LAGLRRALSDLSVCRSIDRAPGGVGGELDAVGMAELLQHVLRLVAIDEGSVDSRHDTEPADRSQDAVGFDRATTDHRPP
jgi:hypothetical protein